MSASEWVPDHYCACGYCAECALEDDAYVINDAMEVEDQLYRLRKIRG